MSRLMVVFDSAKMDDTEGNYVYTRMYRIILLLWLIRGMPLCCS